MRKLVVFGVLTACAIWLIADAVADSPFYWNNTFANADTNYVSAALNHGGDAGKETAIRAQDHESGNFFEGWWSFILDSAVDSIHISAYDLYNNTSGSMAVLDSTKARMFPDRDYVDRVKADSIKLSIFDAGLAATVEIVIEGYQEDQTTWDAK